jgi:DNA polymerase III subunit gamma/tau
MNDLMLKHRPNNLSEVWGNEVLKAQWARYQKANKFPKAIMLSGGFGAGKTTLGRILGCDIVERSKDRFSVGDGFNERDSVDYGLDSFKREMDIADFRHGTIVYFFDEFHRMPEKTQEAFLKPIEDYDKMHFIFATTAMDKVNEGILSRCDELEVLNPSTEILIEKLRRIAEAEKIVVTNEELEIIVDKSNYSPRKCLILLQKFVG